MQIEKPKYLSKDYLSEIESDLSEINAGYAEMVLGKSLIERREIDNQLCGKGLISEKDLLESYSLSSQIEKVSSDEVTESFELYRDVSVDYAKSNNVLVLSLEGEEELTVLISDIYKIEDLIYLFAKMYRVRVKFLLMRRSSLEQLISKYYVEEVSEVMAEDEESLKTLASEAKIVRFVNEIFARAVELEVSDIHIEPKERELSIRFRIDGILISAMNAAISDYPAIASRIKLVGGLNIAETRLPQDGRTNIKLGKNTIDVRISTIPAMIGESIVMRLLSKNEMEFSLSNIGMNAAMCAKFEELIKIPYGMILVVGPTGSGKTTTLYSVMSLLNNVDKKIITIEDPVEYQQEDLTQIQVNHKIGMDFASGLRHIVRQDPDIILVGEIRDKETAEIAINAALTGHLVLSTLHTNDAVGAISRLVDMGIDGFLISSALSGVLSQRLVRKVCDKCDDVSYRSKSGECSKCSGTGYKGRLGIFELMEVNEKISQGIAQKIDSSKLEALAVENGMIPLRLDGLEKAEKGLTREAEVCRVTANI